MNDPTVELEDETRGEAHPQSRTLPPHLAALEKRLEEKLNARLEELKKVVSAGIERVQEKATALVDERIKRGLQGSFKALTNTTKDALNQVVQAILFDSGILEKLVQRIVEERLKEAGAIGGGGAAAAGSLSEEQKKETLDLFQKELSAALASEQMKMLIDDKFRAISLYLKSDVIPKAVQEALKPKAAPQGGSPTRTGSPAVVPAPKSR